MTGLVSCAKLIQKEKKMTNTLNITIAQLNPLVGDVDGNLRRARKMLAALPENTDLVIFPELFIAGYPAEDLVLKPAFLDAVEKALNTLVQESGKIALLIGCPWRDGEKIYNAVHLVQDGSIRATRYKNHLPNYGVFDEVRIFSPGPLPEPIDFHGHKLGVMICEDVWFPDVAAHLKQRGADLLIVPNASPFEIGKLEQRLDICARRARETGLPLIYVNQIGGQDELVFDGASFVVNESGTCIIRAEEFIEDVVHTVWEETPTGHWLCAAGDIKRHRSGPELIYEAVTLGLRDYVTKNGFPGVLLGMSGGIDSALSAAIATDALGPDAVHCVMLPSIYTSAESINDAADCCGALHLTLDNIAIKNPVESVEEALDHHFNTTTPGITHENIQSRMRGLLLMALSNASGRMVLSTGNKSEMATGYATLYGDMCGGFNAIKDVYKTDVFAMAKWRNTTKPDHGFGPAGHVIPDNIISKPPTAELKPGQKDQDTLPPYDILDDILRGLIEEELDIAALEKRGHNPDLIRRIWMMLDRAEYKRRQAAPGVKITAKAFGRERRYPITNLFKA